MVLTAKEMSQVNFLTWYLAIMEYPPMIKIGPGKEQQTLPTIQRDSSRGATPGGLKFKPEANTRMMK